MQYVSSLALPVRILIDMPGSRHDGQELILGPVNVAVSWHKKTGSVSIVYQQEGAELHGVFWNLARLTRATLPTMRRRHFERIKQRYYYDTTPRPDEDTNDD